jgi:hypothetical protein
MFVAKFRSIGEAALQAGNSESIIRKHYLDHKDPSEAEQFFGIVPKRRAKPCPAGATVADKITVPFPAPQSAERIAS